MAESEDLFAGSKGIQENQKLQDKGTAKPILPRTRRKLTRKEDIFNHNEARTNGGDKIVESSERVGSRRTL